VKQISLQPFFANFVGSEGDYKVVFVPTDAGNGVMKTTIGLTPMIRHVDSSGSMIMARSVSAA
jgi:hypothetical protein